MPPIGRSVCSHDPKDHSSVDCFCLVLRCMACPMLWQLLIDERKNAHSFAACSFGWQHPFIFILSMQTIHRSCALSACRGRGEHSDVSTTKNKSQRMPDFSLFIHQQTPTQFSSQIHSSTSDIVDLIDPLALVCVITLEQPNRSNSQSFEFRCSLCLRVTTSIVRIQVFTLFAGNCLNRSNSGVHSVHG